MTPMLAAAWGGHVAIMQALADNGAAAAALGRDKVSTTWAAPHTALSCVTPV